MDTEARSDLVASTTTIHSYFVLCEARGRIRQTDPDFAVRALELLIQLLPDVQPEADGKIRAILGISATEPVDSEIRKIISLSSEPPLQHVFIVPALRCLCAMLEHPDALTPQQIEQIASVLLPMSDFRHRHPEFGRPFD